MGALTLSFLVSNFFLILCLLIQVMKTEWPTEMFLCCFHDPNDLSEPPAMLVRARGKDP